MSELCEIIQIKRNLELHENNWTLLHIYLYLVFMDSETPLKGKSLWPVLSKWIYGWYGRTKCVVPFTKLFFSIFLPCIFKFQCYSTFLSTRDQTYLAVRTNERASQSILPVDGSAGFAAASERGTMARPHSRAPCKSDGSCTTIRGQHYVNGH